MSAKNYEESGYNITLGFAKHLIDISYYSIGKVGLSEEITMQDMSTLVSNLGCQFWVGCC